MWLPIVIGLAYALPIMWAITVVVRLGENTRLLKRIADDISAIRQATGENQSSLRGK